MKWFVEKERDKPYASGARQVSTKLLFLTECLEYELGSGQSPERRQVVSHFIQTNVPDDFGNSGEQIDSDSHRGSVRWYENMTCLYLNWFVYELTCDSFKGIWYVGYVLASPERTALAQFRAPLLVPAKPERSQRIQMTHRAELFGSEAFRSFLGEVGPSHELP